MKDIKGFEGIYTITKEGKIWSYPKVVIQNEFGSKRRYAGYWAKPSINSRYHQIRLRTNGKAKNVLVHRLVAQAFIPNPYNKPEINHINGVKSDNRVENLEWCTNRENQEHAYRTGLKKIASSGEKYIHWDNVQRKWRVCINNLDGSVIKLGRYKNIDEARIVRDKFLNSY